MLPALTRRGGRSLWLDSPLDLFREELERLGDNIESYGQYGAYPVDIWEDDQHVYVEAEMPGFTKDQIDVTLEKGVLAISAERKVEERQGTPHLSQRRFTRINRRFALPEIVDEQNVDAKLNDGVLKLTLQKREEVRPRKIEVS